MGAGSPAPKQPDFNPIINLHPVQVNDSEEGGFHLFEIHIRSVVGTLGFGVAFIIIALIMVVGYRACRKRTEKRHAKRMQRGLPLYEMQQRPQQPHPGYARAVPVAYNAWTEREREARDKEERAHIDEMLARHQKRQSMAL